MSIKRSDRVGGLQHQVFHLQFLASWSDVSLQMSRAEHGSTLPEVGVFESILLSFYLLIDVIYQKIVDVL